MKLLFKNVQLIHGTKPEIADIEIVNGTISQIGNVEASPEHQVFSQEGLSCSIGWFDPFVNFAEPGLEHKEDLASGILAAAHGGFTQVGILPYTAPIIDNKPQVDFIKNATAKEIVHCLVSPSFVKAENFSELSEMMELADSGIMAFVQPEEVVLKTSVVLKALEYSKVTHKKLVVYVTDHCLVSDAFIHEGKVNVAIGMRGIPDFSEELLVKRYVELLKYTGAAMHISGISSRKSLQYITEAKKLGLNITAGVAVYNLLFTEENCRSFNTSYKLNPPLRSEEDRLALLDAVKNGLIDVVSSHHSPHEDDAKKTEMHLASFGVIGVQTLFSALLSVLPLHMVVDVLTNRNRDAFSIAKSKIAVGAEANLVFFNENNLWKFNTESNKSKSENSMFLNTELHGEVLGIVSRGQFLWHA